MLKEIDYNKLKGLDIVFTGGRGLLPFLIRKKEVGKNRKNIPTHVGMIISIYGQKLLVEAVGDGIRINSLEKYLNSRKRYIIAIKRHEYITEELRILGQAFLAEVVRRQIEYDYKGLFNFVFKNVKQDRKKYFCSELVNETYKRIGLTIYMDSSKVTPYDVYRYPHLKPVL